MKKTDPLSIYQIEGIAKATRKKFGVIDDEFFPILEVLNSLFLDGALSIQIISNSDQMLNENIIAKYNPIDNFIYIKEAVIDEYENHEYRANFTLAHEFFHFIQNKILNFDFETVAKCDIYRDAEWQANEFAGQLLIPTQYIDLSTEKLVEQFHVSLYCATTRKLYLKRRKKRKIY